MVIPWFNRFLYVYVWVISDETSGFILYIDSKILPERERERL